MNNKKIGFCFTGEGARGSIQSGIALSLSLKGIKTDFFRTPTHYGLHYEDQRTGEELYWCIITPLAMSGAAKDKKEYAAMFNKYKNPQLNGVEKIKESDIKLISDDEFAEMNISPINL